MEADLVIEIMVRLNNVVIRYHIQFFSKILGGGLIAKSGNKWFLRGITSAVVYEDSELSSCDRRNYALFTDVSKFTGWIQGFVRTYG
jgi:hypothetical protein